jgi:hypothetical protein
MTATTSQFCRRAAIALNDVHLQEALDGATAKFATAREQALARRSFRELLKSK